jgi:phosphoribosylanthranilate isomerase
MSTWVKVCGLTRPADVEATIRAGADAVGLVLVTRSVRRIDPVRAAELAAIAEGRVEVVVLLEGSPDSAVSLATRIGADTVQPYGAEAVATAEAAMAADLGALLPVPVAAGVPIDVSAVPVGAHPLLDTATTAGSGGSGRSFEWRLARGVEGAVVAGGLNPGNVADAIAAARPWGVDASSGLEAAAGVKDHGKVAAFIEAAKSAEE